MTEILPTQNKNWGFWGVASNYTDKEQMPQLWEAADAYPLGVLLYEENGYSYQIATPEKALCDKLYSLPPVKNLTELRALLFDDIRIDEDELMKLNKDDIEKIAPWYRANNLKLFVKFFRKWIKENEVRRIQ